MIAVDGNLVVGDLGYHNRHRSLDCFYFKDVIEVDRKISEHGAVYHLHQVLIINAVSISRIERDGEGVALLMAVNGFLQTAHQIPLTDQGNHRTLGISAADDLAMLISNHKTDGRNGITGNFHKNKFS